MPTAPHNDLSADLRLSRRTLLLGAAASVVLASCSGNAIENAAPVDFLNNRRRRGDPLYSVESSAFVAQFEADLLADAQATYSAALLDSCRLGVIALSDKCTRDGARVGYCPDAQGYLCSACGSLYDRVGDQLMGSAPRGLDHLHVEQDRNGDLIIDRRRKVNGSPAGTGVIRRDDTAQAAFRAGCQLGSAVNPVTRQVIA